MPVNKVVRRGSYAPLSAHYYKDDRLMRAGEKAEVLYLRGLAFCADVLNDGYITDAQLAHVGVGLTNLKGRAKTLMDVGAWERAAGGYRVVAWLHWNKSRDEILNDAKRDADRKGGRSADQPLPPDPPVGERDDEVPDSGRNPDGNPVESGRNPTLAYGPVRAPSNSRAYPELAEDEASCVGQASAAREERSATRKEPTGKGPQVRAAFLVGEVLPRTIGRECRGELARACGNRLKVGVTEAVVVAALERWVNTTGAAPGAIGWMLDDAVKEAAGATRAQRGRVQTADSVQSALTLAAKYAAQEAEEERMGAVVQLPRTATG